MIASDVDTCTNLIILEMLDFDVIHGMDLFSHYYVIMDSFAKIITLSIPGIPQSCHKD